MKHTRTIPNWLTACGLVIAMAATALAEVAKERTVEVVRIKGSARYSTGNNIWQPLKVGTRLKAGAIVQTAANSVVDMGLTGTGVSIPPMGGSASANIDYMSYAPTTKSDVVRMQPDTVLAIDKLLATDTGADIVTETQLDLRSGVIIGRVNKLSAASIFEIKIPNGIAGVRGTLFMCSAAGKIACAKEHKGDKGSMGFASGTPQGPKVKIVDAGFEYDSTTDQMGPFSLPSLDIPPDLNVEPLTRRAVPRDKTDDNLTGTVGTDPTS